MQLAVGEFGDVSLHLRPARRLIPPCGKGVAYSRPTNPRENPFNQTQPALMFGSRAISPYAGRIQAMFRSMRDPVLTVFDGIHPAPVRSVAACLKGIDERLPDYIRLSLDDCAHSATQHIYGRAGKCVNGREY